MDFKTTITDFENAYADLLTLAQTYPTHLQVQAGACGHWSAQDVIAHLCGWLVEAKRRYPRYAEGTGDMQYNVDMFNDVSVWLRRDKAYAEIVTELQLLSTDLAQMARVLTNPERDPRYSEWLTSLTREAREHGAQLQQFAEQYA